MRKKCAVCGEIHLNHIRFIQSISKNTRKVIDKGGLGGEREEKKNVKRHYRGEITEINKTHN